jgi:hypothetical protein
LPSSNILPTGIMQTITNEAQSGFAAATPVISDAKSAVSSAVDTVGTAIGAKIPRNCTLGVKYFCVNFDDHRDCQELPLVDSNAMPTIIGHGTMETLDRALSNITLGFEASLIASFIFASIALISGIVFVFSLWKRQLGFLCHFGGWQISPLTTICLVSTIACCISLSASTFVLYKVLSAVQNLPKVERGALNSQLLGALSCAIIMGLATAITTTLDLD